MKKLICIMMIAAMCLPLAACNVAEPTVLPTATQPTTQSTGTHKTDPTPTPSFLPNPTQTEEIITFEYPEVIEYTVYREGGYDSILLQAEKDGKVKLPVENNSSFWDDLRFEYNEEITGLDWLDSTKEIEINLLGEVLKIEYDRTRRLGSNFSKCVNPFVRTDKEIIRYIMDYPGQNAIMGYECDLDAESGELVYFDLIKKEMPTGDFTLEDAKKKAEKLFAAEFGDSFTENYGICTQSVENRIVLWYGRKIGDYYSDIDCVKIVFDLQGNITLFSRRGYGCLDGVMDKLTEENVNAAWNTLKSCYGDEFKFDSEPVIKIHKDTGVCYIEVSKDLRVYYINIY